MLGFKDDLQKLTPGTTMKAFEEMLGRELGVVRISLGLASNFQDVLKVVRFAALMGEQVSRKALWDLWVSSRNNVEM